jgi:protein-S-isoprenylcysteine O-methyltransferase Ste14
MRSLELRVPPVAVVLAFGLAMAAVARLFPLARVGLPGRLVAAIVLVSAGVLVAATGVLTFRRQKTTVNPMTPEQSSALVVTGIYCYSRNPMYLGFLLVLAGWGAYLANLVALLLLPLFILYMNRFQIAPEERALSAKFGRPFDDYTRAVRRWL